MRSIKFILVLAAIGLLTFTSHAQSFITNGLVAYYPFNGDANDASGNGNDATNVQATLCADRFGNPDSAYNFDGTASYIGFATPPVTQVDNWSVVAWVKPASLNQSGIAVCMGYDDGFTGNGYSLGVSAYKAPGSQLYAIFGYIDFYSGGFTFTDTNRWYQIVMLRNSGTTSFFVNGVLTSNGTTTTPLVPTSFRIGSENGVRFFNGAIDDVRIYNRALSSNEVAQLFAIETVSPKITAQPTNVTVNIGDTVSFSVSATGIAPLNYQWLKDGIFLPNATNSTLTFTNVQPPLIGDYMVAVSDTNGSVTSSSASLSISNIDSALWQGLVAYYPFNGNANDASGNSNNATTVQATLCADRFGNPDSAYNFDGTDSYIGFANPPVTQVDNWSLVAWVKPKSLDQIGIAVGLGYDDGHTGNGYSLGIAGTNLAPGNQLYSIFGNINGFPSGFTFPSIDEWYQIVMLRDSGTTRFFVNGILTSDSTTTTPLVPTAFRIGSNTGVRFFDGAIDDVRIYNRALSSNDVAQLYVSEAPPHAAIGIATLAGATVAAVNIIDNGGGYTNTPLVRFIGGGGSGAQAVVVISNGVVTAINLINVGDGYTNAPLVVIDPPFISNPVLGIASISVLNFSNLTAGSSYQLQQFQSPNWINQGVGFTAGSNIYTQVVSGGADSGEYRLEQTPAPAQALATPQVINGFVVRAFLISGGSGYVTPPTVTIIANVGSNATAVAGINRGAVTNVSIINAGMGYVNPVTIQIAPPPVTALSPTVSPALEIDSSVLAPYDNYQIQFKPDIGAVWGNLSGGLFSPTNAANSQYIYFTNNIGFFRLQYVP
jgi:hypothetical protein